MSSFQTPPTDPTEVFSQLRYVTPGLWIASWRMWLMLGLIVVLAALIWRYLTSSLTYWQRKGVPSLSGSKPLVGSMWTILSIQEHLVVFFKRAYEEFDGKPFGGYYQGNTPSLMLRDPGLIKQILVKDFSHFADHGFKIHEEADPLEAKNLFNLEGQKWRDMRNKLTPTFTSGRMKAMFPLVLECAEELDNFVLGLVKTGEEFEAKELMSKYTTNVIGSCAFGVKCNSLEDPNNEFRKMGKKLLETTLWRSVKMFIIIFFPKVSIALRLAFIDNELTNYFRKMVRDIIDLRAKTGETRKDFMQLLIELKEKGQISPEDGETEELSHTGIPSTLTNLSEDDIVAQATIFFLAGFETSSTATSFSLLELAANPDIQRRLHQEIDEVLERYDGKMTYQAILDMHYLDCVLQESMRKYPPAVNIMRICTKNYLIPDTDITIEEGTPVVIPSHALHNDPNHFPDPERFDPDRFTDVESTQKHKFVYMPFGEGPRQCIGNRFALMQSKLGLLAVLRKYEVHLCPRTNYPAVFTPKELFLANHGGIWLKATLRTEE